MQPRKKSRPKWAATRASWRVAAGLALLPTTTRHSTGAPPLFVAASKITLAARSLAKKAEVRAGAAGRVMKSLSNRETGTASVKRRADTGPPCPTVGYRSVDGSVPGQGGVDGQGPLKPYSVEQCAAVCDSLPGCGSFETDGSICQLNEVKDPSDQGQDNWSFCQKAVTESPRYIAPDMVIVPFTSDNDMPCPAGMVPATPEQCQILATKEGFPYGNTITAAADSKEIAGCVLTYSDGMGPVVDRRNMIFFNVRSDSPEPVVVNGTTIPRSSAPPSKGHRVCTTAVKPVLPGYEFVAQSMGCGVSGEVFTVPPAEFQLGTPEACAAYCDARGLAACRFFLATPMQDCKLFARCPSTVSLTGSEYSLLYARTGPSSLLPDYVASDLFIVPFQRAVDNSVLRGAPTLAEVGRKAEVAAGASATQTVGAPPDPMQCPVGTKVVADYATCERLALREGFAFGGQVTDTSLPSGCVVPIQVDAVLGHEVVSTPDTRFVFNAEGITLLAALAPGTQFTTDCSPAPTPTATNDPSSTQSQTPATDPSPAPELSYRKREPRPSSGGDGAGGGAAASLESAPTGADPPWAPRVQKSEAVRKAEEEMREWRSNMLKAIESEKQMRAPLVSQEMDMSRQAAAEKAQKEQDAKKEAEFLKLQKDFALDEELRKAKELLKSVQADSVAAGVALAPTRGAAAPLEKQDMDSVPPFLRPETFAANVRALDRERKTADAAGAASAETLPSFLQEHVHAEAKKSVPAATTAAGHRICTKMFQPEVLGYEERGEGRDCLSSGPDVVRNYTTGDIKTEGQPEACAAECDLDKKCKWFVSFPGQQCRIFQSCGDTRIVSETETAWAYRKRWAPQLNGYETFGKYWMRGNICDNSDTENWLGTVPKGPPLTCSSVCNATFGCGYFGSSPNDDCALFKRCDAQIRAPNLREIGGVMMYRKELRPAGVLACGDTDYFFAGAGQDECPNGGARYETASESECLSIWNEHCWPSIELTISNALGMFSVTDKTTSPSGCYANFGPELSAGHYNQEVGVAALDTDDRILCSRIPPARIDCGSSGYFINAEGATRCPEGTRLAEIPNAAVCKGIWESICGPVVQNLSPNHAQTFEDKSSDDFPPGCFFSLQPDKKFGGFNSAGRYDAGAAVIASAYDRLVCVDTAVSEVRCGTSPYFLAAPMATTCGTTEATRYASANDADCENVFTKHCQPTLETRFQSVTTVYKKEFSNDEFPPGCTAALGIAENFGGYNAGGLLDDAGLPLITSPAARLLCLRGVPEETIPCGASQYYIAEEGQTTCPEGGPVTFPNNGDDDNAGVCRSIWKQHCETSLRQSLPRYAMDFVTRGSGPSACFVALADGANKFSGVFNTAAEGNGLNILSQGDRLLCDKTYGFVYMGKGSCPSGDYTSAAMQNSAATTTASCAAVCREESQCRYFSVSPSTSQCLTFDANAGSCTVDVANVDAQFSLYMKLGDEERLNADWLYVEQSSMLDQNRDPKTPLRFQTGTDATTWVGGKCSSTGSGEGLQTWTATIVDQKDGDSTSATVTRFITKIVLWNRMDTGGENTQARLNDADVAVDDMVVANVGEVGSDKDAGTVVPINAWGSKIELRLQDHFLTICGIHIFAEPDPPNFSTPVITEPPAVVQDQQNAAGSNQGDTTSTTTTEAPPTGYSLAEVPKCEGCGNRAHECWGTCGADAEAPGYCDKCDSAEGSKGACCIQGSGGANDPDECQKAVEYPAGDTGEWHVLPRS